MPPKILLVTGSRALCESKRAEEWTQNRLDEAFAFLDAPRDVVVAGDAKGPDRWALAKAKREGFKVRSFRLDGTVDGGGEPYVPTQWGPWLRGDQALRTGDRFKQTP